VSQAPRRMRAWAARRIGRLLGLTDLREALRSVHERADNQQVQLDLLSAQQRPGAHATRVSAELDRLREQIEAIQAHVALLKTDLAVLDHHVDLGVMNEFLARTTLAEDHLISIVLSGRGDGTTERAVASVLAQSYTNWELLMVHDRERGESDAIADPRIRRIDARHGVAAGHTALNAARGDYVAYMEDTDVMHPHWLHGIALAFALHPHCDVVIGTRIVDDERHSRGLGRGGTPRVMPASLERDRVLEDGPPRPLQIAHRRRVTSASPDPHLDADRPNDLYARLNRERESLWIPIVAGIECTSTTVVRGAARHAIASRPQIAPSASLVSVVTPFFNAAAFLEEAIDSVFAQTYRHWELLLVDDGSADASSEIARRYADRFPHQVRYLAHRDFANRGEGATRNLGMQEARGEWIAFVDADDVWLPHKLQTQIALSLDHPDVGLVFGPMLVWPPQLRTWGLETVRDLRVETDRVWEPPALAVRFIDGTANAPGVISALVRSDVVRSVGGCDELLTIFADQMFFVRLCLSEPVFVHAEALERYRQHGDSACARAEAAGVYDPDGGPSASHAQYLERLAVHLRADRVRDAEVWRALQDARARYGRSPRPNEPTQ
jgi:glycosyltransferase involved in cell wall biosynthesis